MKHKPQPGVSASQVIPREAAVRQIDPICDALADACRRSADRAERRLLARRRVPAVTARASRGLAEGVPAESSGTLVAVAENSPTANGANALHGDLALFPPRAERQTC